VVEIFVAQDAAPGRHLTFAVRHGLIEVASLIRTQFPQIGDRSRATQILTVAFGAMFIIERLPGFNGSLGLRRCGGEESCECAGSDARAEDRTRVAAHSHSLLPHHLKSSHWSS